MKIACVAKGVGSAVLASTTAARVAVVPAVELAKKAAPVIDLFESTPALVQRANSTEDLLRSRQLLYTQYAAKGYLETDPVRAKPAGTFHGDQSHSSPAARRRGQTFFVEGEDGSVVATGVLIRDSAAHVSRFAENFGLPLDKSVPGELAALRNELGPSAQIAEFGGVAAVGETSGLASVKVLKALRRGGPESHPVTALFNALHAHAKAQGVTDVVMGVSGLHAGFYERLGFRERAPVSGGPRADYVGLQNAQVVLLHGKIDEVSLKLARG